MVESRAQSKGGEAAGPTGPPARRGHRGRGTASRGAAAPSVAAPEPGHIPSAGFTPDISIVTLCWNSERFIKQLLSSLFADAAQSRAKIETIVVDNGSTDGTVSAVAEFQRRQTDLFIVRLPTNQGTTVSRNIGIRMARGKYFLIVDSDTQIPRGTLDGLMGSLDELPVDQSRIGIIHPRLVYPDGRFQESARRFPTVQTKIFRLFRLETWRSADESVPAVLRGESTPVDYAVSAAWFVPRATFERVGLLDERIFYAPEDVEFCARCWRHGLEVWYYDRVHIIHDCQRLTSKLSVTPLALSHARGLVRFWWEYGQFFSRPEHGSAGRGGQRPAAPPDVWASV